jgi:hypothetical protein
LPNSLDPSNIVLDKLDHAVLVESDITANEGIFKNGVMCMSLCSQKNVKRKQENNLFSLRLSNRQMDGEKSGGETWPLQDFGTEHV